MATTESRSGFRLPWSADRASLRDGSDGYAEGESQTGEPQTGDSTPDADTTDIPERAMDADAAATAPVTPTQVGPRPEHAAESIPVPPLSAPKRPTKFLVDMIHAMQAAAEQARAATLEQFRVEGSSYVEQIQGRSVADSEALRRRADEDVARIKDWSKAEIARIRDETESRVSGRRAQLDGQLARHTELVERDIARIQGQIAFFETEMATFFDELLAETDLTILAAHAQQMPEAPAFDEPDTAAFTELMTEPAVGIPPAEPIAEPEPVAVPVLAPEPVAELAVAPELAVVPSPEPEPSAASPDAIAETVAIAIDGQASPEAEADEAARSDTPADAPVAVIETAPPSMALESRPAIDPRLAMLGLTPDFAAAEAAAAEAAAAELDEIPEIDEENLVARLAGLIPTPSSGAPANAVQAAPVVSTQVIVTGLVSVASIASFKRHLSREAGVRHVGVSSGPDGEFLFTVQHDGEVSLRDLIPALPGFQARVTGGSDGIVTASAHDPED